jgi:hypothetical protein
MHVFVERLELDFLDFRRYELPESMAYQLIAVTEVGGRVMI